MNENMEAGILLKRSFYRYFFKCWSAKMVIFTPNCVDCACMNLEGKLEFI